MTQTALPESFERDEPAHGSSDRGFGLVFAVVLLIIGLSRLVRGAEPRWWALALAAAFLAVALLRPALLAPLNRQWTRLGLLMHKVVNPVVMGLLFYLVLTPVGMLQRRLGNDAMRRRFDPNATTYWIRRIPPGPSPETMKNQF